MITIRHRPRWFGHVERNEDANWAHTCWPTAQDVAQLCVKCHGTWESMQGTQQKGPSGGESYGESRPTQNRLDNGLQTDLLIRPGRLVRLVSKLRRLIAQSSGDYCLRTTWLIVPPRLLQKYLNLFCLWANCDSHDYSRQHSLLEFHS